MKTSDVTTHSSRSQAGTLLAGPFELASRLARSLCSQGIAANICSISLLLALFAAGPHSQAGAEEVYPSRPVKLINPYTTGGSADVIARIIASEMSERLGQPVLVENRPGAAGVVGTTAGARAAPDGYSLLLGVVGPFSISPIVNPQAAKYDPVKDFAPISLITRIPAMLVVPASSPVKSVDDLIKLGKSSDKFNFPSSGVGSYGHLAGEIFNLAAGTKFLHVPYKGTSEQIPDLILGRVHMGFFGTGDVVKYINSGQLRGLAVFTEDRWPTAPNVPTNAEANFRHSLPEVWFGIVAPAGTPVAIVNRLNEVTRHALADAKVKERFDKIGFVLTPSTPSEFATYIKKDNEQYKEVVRAAKIAVE